MTGKGIASLLKRGARRTRGASSPPRWDHPLLRHLVDHLDRAKRVNIAVAFTLDRGGGPLRRPCATLSNAAEVMLAHKRLARSHRPGCAAAMPP